MPLRITLFSPALVLFAKEGVTAEGRWQGGKAHGIYTGIPRRFCSEESHSTALHRLGWKPSKYVSSDF